MTRSRSFAVLAAATVSALAIGGVAGPVATAAPPAPPPTPSQTPCAPTARACVDLSAHRAWLTDGAGHVTYGPVPARGGSADAPTPVGTTTVLWKDRDHRSRQFDDAPMPWSVFFAPGIAFHGGDPSENSNGCIHLGQRSAPRFYSGLDNGDEVQVVP